jgi:hypothetical protein
LRSAPAPAIVKNTLGFSAVGRVFDTVAGMRKKHALAAKTHLHRGADGVFNALF